MGVGIGVLLLLAAACTSGSGSGGNAGVANNHNPVTVRLVGDIDTLDPQLQNTVPAYMATALAYDTLVAVNAKNQVIPAVAERWEVAAKSVTLHLRSDVKCTDGTPVTPSVVKASLERLLGLPAAATNRHSVFGTGEITIEAQDASNTLKITSSVPYSDLLPGLSVYAASIICPAGLKDPATLATKSEGSGPYTLTSSVRGDHYVFASRTDAYLWGPGGQKLGTASPSKITLQVIADETTAANTFLTGQLNIVSLSGQERLRVLRQSQSRATHKDAISQTITMVFNQSAGHVTANLAVRKAIAQAFDRVAYAKVATGEDGNSGASFIANVTPCYSETVAHEVPHFDSKAAAQTLTEAGWKRGSDGKWSRDGNQLTLKFLVTARTPGGEYVLEELEQFGIKVNMRNIDLNSYVGQIFGPTGDYDVVLLPAGAGNSFSPATASDLLLGPVPPKGRNITRLTDESATQSAMAARQATGTDRCKFWIAAQVQMATNVDFVPMANTVQSWIGENLEFELGYQGIVSPASIRWTK